MKKQQAKKYYVYTIAYNGEIMYVGKTSNMAKRKSKHKTQRGTSSSAIPIDADMSKVEFNIVAEFDNKEEALKYEDQLILRYNTLNGGWNKYRSGLVCSDREYILTQKAAYNRDYNSAHKEEKAAYMRDYQAAHREDLTAYQRDYQATHKKERAVYRAAKRERILEQHREYMRDYRARKKAEGAK